MPDTVSIERRKEIMSHIRSKNTSIELIVRRELFSLGYRYRVNYKQLPGKPDIVFTKKKVAIFIHGCFWHGHEVGCRYSHVPQSRVDYWQPKIQRTKQRDFAHIADLQNKEWKVIVIWECEVRNDTKGVITKIISHL